MDIDPQYPDVGEEARKALLVTREELEREAPAGALADPYTGPPTKKTKTMDATNTMKAAKTAKKKRG